jgi:hypothetical protein
MSTLVERAQTLTKHLTDLNQLAVHRANFQMLRTRSKQLDDRTKDLDNAVCSVAVLKKGGLKLGETPTPSKELCTRSEKLHEISPSDWMSVIGNDQIASTFLNPIETYTKRLREFASTVWRQHIDNVAPKINDALLSTLKTVLGSQVARLQALRQELEALRVTLPVDEATFSRLNSIVAEIKTIWGQLEGVPEAVRIFLVRAAQRQATVSDLTPDVREWLEKNSMLDQLRIGFA